MNRKFMNPLTPLTHSFTQLLHSSPSTPSLAHSAGPRLAMPKIRKNSLIEIIPINTGCLNQCTYCKTKHARGELNSYPSAEIVARVQQVIAEGVVEIWLTSEDTGTYGRDIGESIVDLLWKIVEVMQRNAVCSAECLAEAAYLSASTSSFNTHTHTHTHARARMYP